ncbi:MAG: SAM-dependent methyltransferase [Alphaproteobacteria bacterium HGW-Alphaproteobacteria-7]|jgi:2-polyprenyl-3-methyl-5-hydroxy-6-metoxy-1,4-benzoquinol methylase|nr:MAG: SAM-dependent methyltransferase [Alphaproteobacteria bacterium HGW-Alphaproteobacteria-7]
MTEPRVEHWDSVYQKRAADELSWYQSSPDTSLDAIKRHCGDSTPAVIDIGGGMSRLAAELARSGFNDVAVLDISQQALARAAAEAGVDGAAIDWICADITDWQPSRQYQVWHDRAVFHFLIDSGQRDAYRKAMLAGLAPGGLAIIATFAPDGPEKCSGLPVQRYSPAQLGAALGDQFRLIESWGQDHQTPGGNVQAFNWCIFRRAIS